MRFLSFLFCSAVAISYHARAQDLQIQLPVEKYKLANGLTVILLEDHSSPLVSYQTWYKVGSRNEQIGSTGLAHLFEHMMFKGTQKNPGKSFDQMLRKLGVTNNAYTTQDKTVYYEVLPTDALEKVIELESDRMQGLVVTEQSLRSEIEVVKEERRMRYDNSVEGEMREILFSILYKVHPYRWPVIGSMVDLDNTTVKKCMDFYHTFYAPNNAVLTVVGDFQTSKLKLLLEKYYGALQASSNIKEPMLDKEPEQHDMRQQIIERNVQSESVLLGFRSVASGEDDMYAIDLLSSVLSDGSSSRLYKKLVYELQLVTGVHVYQHNMKDSGMLVVMLQMRPGVSREKAIKAVQGEIWRIKNSGITDNELEKVKNMTMKSYIDGLKTNQGKANMLGAKEVYHGDYQLLYKDLQKYASVSREQITKIADKYFNFQNMNMVVALPKGNK